MSSYHERQDCRLCSAPLPAERVLDLNSSPLANALLTQSQFSQFLHHTTHPDSSMRVDADVVEPRYPLYLKQCTQCGHVQLPVVVDPKLLFPADYPYCSSVGESMRKHLEKQARDLERHIPRQYNDEYGDGMLMPVVEIGSNDGYLLKMFSIAGHQVLGIDPAAELARKATRDGLLTVPDFFSQDVAVAANNAIGDAGLVVANNVCAHVEDLHGLVEGVKILLGDDGSFVFEVGYLGDVLQTNNWPALYHEHLSVHSIAPLVAFFEFHKMTLYDVWNVGTQGGSIRCFVRKGRAGKRAKKMRDILAREAALDIPGQLAGWQSRVNSAAKQFAATLHTLKAQGKTIAGYGCSAKSTTLLHVAGIGRETIDFICDSNPLKQGRFSPGKHIPIVHPDELERRQPDYCVSLSSNFSDTFRARHPNYRGQWIEPDLSGRAVAA